MGVRVLALVCRKHLCGAYLSISEREALCQHTAGRRVKNTGGRSPPTPHPPVLQHGHRIRQADRQTDRHTHTHTHTHARTHACARTHTHTRTHTCLQTHTRVRALTQTHTRARTHACTHTKTHALARTDTQQQQQNNKQTNNLTDLIHELRTPR